MRSLGLTAWLRGPVLASLVAILGSAATAAPAAAQDSHYWSEQYGTRATLLGGAVIGSVRDLSAVYYNPGAIALTEGSGFVLSARADRFGSLTFEEGAGPGRDVTSATNRPVPTLVAGSLDFEWLGDHRISYSVLTRQQFDARATLQRIEEIDVLPAAGPEEVASAFSANASIRETWYGLTWSYRLGESVGVGVSTFLADRAQSLDSDLLAQGATQAGEVVIGTRFRRRSFRAYRLLWKAGVAFERNAWEFGANLTTASVGLEGNGQSQYNSSSTGIDLDDDGIPDGLLAASVQPDLDGTFENSWAIGAGLARTFGRSKVHLSAEWFADQDEFVALDTEPFLPQTGGPPRENDITGEMRSVLNVGAGYEYDWEGVGSLFLSVATDNSTFTSASETDYVITRYDMLRLGGGGALRVGGTELTMGVVWSGGSGTFPELINTNSLQLPEDIFGRARERGLRYRQWTIVFGLDVG